jgi:adenylate cyclase
MPASSFLRIVRPVTRPVGVLTERLGSRFYVGLGVIVAAASILGIGSEFTFGMRVQAYDLVMQNRFRTPPPDPDILLVDIDEASLAAMAPEYGRWPWPRSVMAELIEGVSRAQPAAIVFDVVFSDLDRNQPEGDLYLREVAARSHDTFFAMIRLDAANDARSDLRLAGLAGVTPLPDAKPDATVAMVVPYFFDVLKGRRLGTINLYADEDGIARSYHVHRDVAGHRIHSLPANVVAAIGGGGLAPEPDLLLNWRGAPRAYPSVSFHALYERLLRGEIPAELEGRILIVGSTAPALFDIRPTPIATAHTGLELLATALDNLRNRDFVRLLPDWIYMVITAVAVLLLAMAFRSNVDWLLLRTTFTVMQLAFLAVTYLFLNFTNWFVDLTAPFAAALAYFTVAGFYSRAMVQRRNGSALYSTVLEPGSSAEVLLLACRITATGARRARVHRALQQRAGLTRYGAAAPRLFESAPLFQKLYEDVALFYWIAPPGRTCAALADLFDMLERSLDVLRARRLDADVHFALHAVRFTIDERGDWAAHGKEALMAELMLVQRVSGGPITRTEAFAEACRACPSVTVPSLLAQASGTVQQQAASS